MANNIQPKRSYLPGVVPTLAELGSHECAINWADKILYVKADDGGLTSIALGSGSGGSANIVEAATAAGFPATGSAGTLYHATTTSRIYFYDASGVYVEAGTSGGGGSGSGLTWSSVPASATATGTAGQIAYDGDYLYVAVGSNQWERAALSTWTTFTPSSIAGLGLWLDASDASSLYDATTGGSLVAADGAVARWQDKSGNNRHFTQSSSGSRPLRKTNVQNGRDVIRMDGVNDYMDGGDYLDLTSSSALTIFAVVKRASTGTADKIIVKYGYNTSTGLDYGWDFAFNTANKLTGGVTNGGQYTVLTSDATVAASSFSLVVFKITGGSAKTSGVYYKNGSSLASTYIYDPANGNVQDSGDTTFPVRIGVNEYNGSFSQWFDGDFAEVVVYNTALSDTDRSAAEQYLISKWGIT